MFAKKKIADSTSTAKATTKTAVKSGAKPAAKGKTKTLPASGENKPAKKRVGRPPSDNKERTTAYLFKVNEELSEKFDFVQDALGAKNKTDAFRKLIEYAHGNLSAKKTKK